MIGDDRDVSDQEPRGFFGRLRSEWGNPFFAPPRQLVIGIAVGAALIAVFGVTQAL